MNNLNNDYKAQGCSPHLLSVSISGQNTFLIRYKKIQMKLFGWSGEVLNPVAWSMSRWTDRILILNLSQPGALQLFNSYKSALIRTLRSWLRSNSCTASQRVPKLFSQTRTWVNDHCTHQTKANADRVWKNYWFLVSPISSNLSVFRNYSIELAPSNNWWWKKYHERMTFFIVMCHKHPG